MIPLAHAVDVGIFNEPSSQSASGGGGGTTSPGGTVTGANQYRSAGGTFAGDDLVLDNGAGGFSAVTLTAGNGTMAAPSINFAGSLTSGLTRPGNNQVSLILNAKELVRFAQSTIGVGVSGSAPSATFQVAKVCPSGPCDGSGMFGGQLSVNTTGGSITIPSGGIFVSGSALLTSGVTINSTSIPNSALTVYNLASGPGTGAVCDTSATGIISYSASGCTVSSRIFKENINTLGNALDLVMALKPVTFTYKPEYQEYGTGQQVGLIAEDVDQVLPVVVGHFRLPDGTPYSNVDYARLTAPLIGAVQQIKTRQDVLEARLQELENK